MHILVCNRNQSVVCGSLFAKSFADQSHRPPVIVWDDGSEREDLNQLREICRVHGFRLVESERLGVNGALKTCLPSVNDEWIAVCQSDVVFPERAFMQRLSAALQEIPAEVGSLGFNVLDDEVHSLNFVARCSRSSVYPLGIVGRCNLMDDAVDAPFVGWYRGFDRPYQHARFDLIGKYTAAPFMVEVVSWHMIVFRISHLRRIRIDPAFSLILSMDDNSYQLMLAGYENATLPMLTIYHRSRAKQELGIPLSTASQPNDKYFAQTDANAYWNEKWGFPWGCRPEKVSLPAHRRRQEIVRERFSNTALDHVSRTPIGNGPAKYYEIPSLSDV